MRSDVYFNPISEADPRPFHYQNAGPLKFEFFYMFSKKPSADSPPQLPHQKAQPVRHVFDALTGEYIFEAKGLEFFLLFL